MSKKAKFNGKVSRSSQNTALKQYAESAGGANAYYDPMGYLFGTPIDEREKMKEDGNWGEKFQKFDELVAQGNTLKKAAEKSVSTGDYSLPVYVDEELILSEEEQTPVAEMIPRVAVNTTDLRIDEETSLGAAGFFQEDGTVPENEDNVAKYTYEVESYGRKNRVTDHVQLAASRYNPMDRQIQNQTRAVRRLEEAQIHQGTQANANGFEGLNDWVDTSRTIDQAGASADEQLVRDLVEELEVLGSSTGDIVVTANIRTYGDLKSSIDSFLRFESPDETISFGFKTLEVDGVPVVKSQGLPTASGSREMYAFDASAHWMGMLRDITVQPLAKGVDGSDVAELVHTHAFGVLVSQARKRIAKAENIA